MAHQHLQLKEDIGTDQTHGKQMRISLAMLGTLAGGVMLINSQVGILFFGDGEITKFFAMIGALLLGAPVVWHAFECLLQGHSHMDELAALGIIAAFATGEQYNVDHVAPFVDSVLRLDPNPTTARTVRYEVTFSEAVTGVNAADFQIFAVGPTGTSVVSNVTGSGTTYNLAVSGMNM